MPNVFFTSDEHYGHRSIIQFCKRPFSDIYHMEDELIARHNAKVRPQDHTWHLGDMFWRTLGVEQSLFILRSLNGTHSIIPGNHDELVDDIPQIRVLFEEVVGSMKRPGSVVLPVPQMKKQKLFLSHYAHRVWDKSHASSWHLYGHSHAELPEEGLSFDVGVDNPLTNYAPMELEEIKTEMLKRKSSHVIPADKVWNKFPTDHLPEGSH